VTTCAVLAFCFSAFAEDYRIHSRSVPAGFEGEAAFFELVKWPEEPSGVFDAERAPSWNIEEIGRYIPVQGIEFVDVNHSFQGQIRRDAIIRSLKQRKGQPFRAFAHLSHIYSIPYKQYSELTFKREGSVAVVRMSDWYTLSFQHGGERPQIVRWEYTQLEGD
jgi:hypothetical protein